ncbi:MAG: MopE-related protein, partial [Myxococcota bacterium]
MAADALAAPPNGDFESGLTDWTNASTNVGEAQSVEEGDDFSSATDTTGISFVSPTHAVMLRGGFDGAVESAGAVQSATFRVTHHSLSIWQRSESAVVTPRTFVLDDGGGVIASVNWSPSVGSFTEHTIDLSSACEAEVSVLLRSSTSNEGTGDPDGFTLFDDVELEGTICARYANNDFDTFCGIGRDINNDGDCLDPGEADFLNAIDCDDADPDVHTGATEIVGDGIDQDCDGVDDPGPRQISGAVFEDLVGDGRIQGDPVLPDVTVRVYRDTGDNQVDSFDPLVATTMTDAQGEFTATGLAANETYWVIFDSTTVRSGLGRRAGRNGASVWAEQTWTSSGGMCADGHNGTVTRASTGSCYGGRFAGFSDVPDDPDLAQHVVRVSLGANDVDNVGVGFSFTVITHTGDGDDDLDGPRTVQGSFRQFVANANTVAGTHTLRFVPVTPPTDSGGGGEWWSVPLAFPILSIQSPGLVLDGRAWCNGLSCPLADMRDSNPGVLRAAASAVGVGADRIPDSGDEPALSSVPRPELLIDGGNQGSIEIHDPIEVREMGFHRTGFDVTGAGSIFEDVVVGPVADGSAGDLSEVDAFVIAADNVELRRNWIQVAATALRRTGTYEGLWFEQNTVQAPQGGHTTAHPGIWLSVPLVDDLATGDLVFENLFEGLGGPAVVVDGLGSVLDLIVENNAIVQNGWLDTGFPSTSPAGISVVGVQGDPLTIQRNLVWANAGAGIEVIDTAVGVFVRENATTDNQGPSIDLGADGPTANDGALVVGQPNDGLDSPVVDAAWIDGAGVLRLVGRVGTAEMGIPEVLPIEWFLADDEEAYRYLFGCDTADDGTFDCTVDAATVEIVHGTFVVGTATRFTGTSEAGNAFEVILDSDEDRLSDEEELTVTLTDPFDADSDDDELTDGDEVQIHDTSPTLDDTDGDLLLDGEEINVTLTSPSLADTDGGGTDDGTEIMLALTDPKDPTDDVAWVDADRDMLTDADEILA